MNKIFTGSIKVVALTCLTLTLVLSSGLALSNPKKEPPVAHELTPEKLATLDNKEILYNYESLGRKDPFRPFIDFSQIERSIPTDNDKPLTPLEMYALNQFRLVGIILAGNTQNYALVEDPESIGYTVHVGDMIGNLSGQVKEIKFNEVIIEEPYLDIFDKQQTRIISLRLRDLEDENLLHLENDE